MTYSINLLNEMWYFQVSGGIQMLLNWPIFERCSTIFNCRQGAGIIQWSGGSEGVIVTWGFYQIFRNPASIWINGTSAIGHVRYATAGEALLTILPFSFGFAWYAVWTCSQRKLTNAESLKQSRQEGISVQLRTPSWLTSFVRSQSQPDGQNQEALSLVKVALPSITAVGRLIGLILTVRFLAKENGKRAVVVSSETVLKSWCRGGSRCKKPGRL